MAFDATKKINFVMALSGDDKVKAGVKAVNDGMWDTEKAVSLAKAAFVGLAGVAGVGAFAGMVKGFIDGAAGMHDLAMQTGLSVAALGQFKSVGAYTNTTAEQIGGAMNKLAKNMATLDEDGKGAALAIKALGLDFSKFKALNPDQQMLEVAKAMAGFEDGADKSAAAMMLFGKEGAKMLPFLADLAEKADEITASLTDQEKAFRANQAAMADAFGDNLTKLSKEGAAWKKDLSLGLLPALYEASEAILGMSNGAGGLKAKISELAKDGTLADWARGAMTALSYLVDVLQGLYSIIPMIGHAIAGLVAAASVGFGALGEAATKALSGDFSGAWDSMKVGFEAVKTVGVSAGTSIADIWGQKLLGAEFRARMADLQGIQVEAKDAREKLDIASVLARNEAAKAAAAESAKRAAELAKLEAEAIKKLLAEYDRAAEAEMEYMASIVRKNTALQMELDTGHALTVAQKELIDLDDKIRSGKMSMTAAAEASARAIIAEAAALEANIKWHKESVAENNSAVDAIEKQYEATLKQVDAQRQANAAIGLTGRALLDYENSLTEAKAKSLEFRASTLDLVNPEAAALLRAEAGQWREIATLKGEAFDKKAALDSQAAWLNTAKTIGEGMADALMGGARTFKAYITKLFKDYFVRIPLQGLMTSMVGGIGSMFGMPALASQGGALGAVGNGASMLSGASSIYNVGNLAWQGVGALYGSALGSSAVAGAAATYAAGAGAAAGGGMMGGLVAIDTAVAGTAAGAAAGVGAGATAGVTSALAAIPVYGWIALAVVAAAAMLSKEVTPHVGGYAMAGADGSVSDITAQQGGIKNPETQGLVTVFAQGAARMVNDTAKLFGQVADVSVRSVFESDKTDPSWGLFHLLNAAGGRIGGFDALGTLDKDPAKGFEQYTAQASASIRDALVAMDLPGWVDDILNQLGSTPTMQTLGAALDNIHKLQQALEGMSASLAPLGGIFTQISALSTDAKMQLAGMVGGIDALVAKSRSFVEAYYTKDEQAAIQAAGIVRTATAAGASADVLAALAGLTDKAGFRALFESVDLGAANGLSMAALGLNIQGEFAALSAYLADAGTTLGELAAQALVPAIVAAVGAASANAGGALAAATTTPAAASGVVADASASVVATGAGAVAVPAGVADQLQAVVDAIAALQKELADMRAERLSADVAIVTPAKAVQTLAERWDRDGLLVRGEQVQPLYTVAA